MSKKILAYGDNQSVEVETDGNLWGFKSDDAITCDEQHSGDYWRNKRVIVEGFKGGKLWGTVEREKKSCYSQKSNNLILLERPELKKFKVGDEVGVTSLIKRKGEIIVINPYQYANQQFLIEFENLTNGHDAGQAWEMPWYPSQYKTDSCSRLWVAEDDLEFLSENT